jgi:hypothetical protein
MTFRFLLVLVVGVAAATFAATARADSETLTRYWSGAATSGEYHVSVWDSQCQPTSGSAAEFNAPGYVTVALLDPGGSWRLGYRSNVHPVQIYVTPDTYSQAAAWAKRALCKNSTPWQVSFTMYCLMWFWFQSPVRYHCV